MIAGRVLGAAVVARLHAEPEFLKDLDAAKDEIAYMQKVYRLSVIVMLKQLP